MAVAAVTAVTAVAAVTVEGEGRAIEQHAEVHVSPVESTIEF